MSGNLATKLRERTKEAHTAAEKYGIYQMLFKRNSGENLLPEAGI